MDKARLISRMRPSTSASCFKFWYNMNGGSIGSLSVYKKVNGTGKRIWSKRGNYANRWIYGSIQFESIMPYQVTFYIIHYDD